MASTVCIMKCGDKDIKTLLFSPPSSFPSAFCLLYSPRAFFISVVR